MDVNLMRIFFIMCAGIMGIVGITINLLENYLPIVVTRSYCYGKMSVDKDHPIVERFEIPKRWFKHFYVFAGPASILVLGIIISHYIFHNDVPNVIYQILDLEFGSNRRALVSPETTLLGAVLVTIQCLKRLYETQCVSIFSDARMNVTHYFVGFAHYIGVISCIIGESEGFVRGSTGKFDWSRITIMQYVCAIIFLWASYEQFQTNVILANLRKNKDGTIVANSYKIPHGRLCDYISGPLQFTEIIVYAMLSVIMWESSTCHYVSFWVLVNQAETATLTHSWFHKKFRNYPEQRRVLIPFLY